ncbi:UDP-3-O-acyl-N-acetylglucosamine deacetylase [Cylindrospermopsis raciborskii]|uniref:UDP-3-O-acyl-N-acetylglucosamine deacetylase n=1 Tax=Cylindrospermopsis raciborskii TaxID=77022 RepID=UPI000778DA0F|nr:UDP-3-O-acyl-N-acetylglucosamine deacetylase [Cylindrospermopsis raciborskii]MCZ2200764.1 UDP-3-O-acyl-N-acetylglucosamine deacetylase [Cylindrospermopsis raciborskii PAMP2012]MCZ2205500.1 UDP-3-O-acyl-N-acetylglucosamine deacetylase [Cylindrospermopsis raciborskii PAMP2011]
MHQHTLAAEICQTGVGLHSGLDSTVRILPAPSGSKRYFVRVDLPDFPIIPAEITAVNQTLLSTELGTGNAYVRTVEHLLASLAAMGVDNARIEIDGSEVPLLDGSAQVWTNSIAAVGLTSQPVSDEYFPIVIKEPIYVYEKDAFVCVLPGEDTRFSYGIDFDVPAIGNQWYSFVLCHGEDIPHSFATEIAPARTFGLLHQIEHLQKSGLIKGGTLENALVCGMDGWVNPPLRFMNEPVRHKILDLVGDISLLGQFPKGHFLAYKASHHLHIQLARKILESV